MGDCEERQSHQCPIGRIEKELASGVFVPHSALKTPESIDAYPN